MTHKNQRTRHCRLHILITAIITLALMLDQGKAHKESNAIKEPNNTKEPNATKEQNDGSEKPAEPYETVKYSKYVANPKYEADTNYNAAGMQPLYNITHNIIDHLIGEEALPPGYVEIRDNNFYFGPKVENNEWGDLIRHYWPILLIVVITLIIIALMPILGLCICCCRCFGFCGGKRKHCDNKCDNCLRFVLGALLLLCVVALIFGVIICFAMNCFMNYGIEKSVETLDSGSRDLQLFINETSKETHQFLVPNYKELHKKVKEVYNGLGDKAIERLKAKSGYRSFERLEEFLERLPLINTNLKKIENLSAELRLGARQLSDGLRSVSRELIKQAEDYPAVQEMIIETQINKLSVQSIYYDKERDLYFPQLPFLNAITDELDKILDTRFLPNVEDGHRAIKEMEKQIRTVINEKKPEVEIIFREIGNALSNVSREINAELLHFSKMINQTTDRRLPVAQNYISDYNIFIFYTCLIVCCILLGILLLLIGGLIWGICGRRPAEYNSDCCQKGVGAAFLMIAAYLIFFTISFIAIVALVHFLLGIVMYRGLCEPLSQRRNDTLFLQIDDNIDLNKWLFKQKRGLPPFHFSDVIQTCSENKTIYHVLRLENAIDVNDLANWNKHYKVNERLNGIKQNIVFDKFEKAFLSPEGVEEIRNLSRAPLNDFRSGHFADLLDAEIVERPLHKIIATIRERMAPILAPERKKQVILLNQALHLDTYQTQLVEPMQAQVREMAKLAKEIADMLSFDKNTMEEGLITLLMDIERAGHFLQREGDNFLRYTVENATTYIATEFIKYIAMVINAVDTEIGQCAPIHRVLHANQIMACNRIMDPVNGFWFGLFLCILLFFPIVMLLIKLASLYRKAEPYAGPCCESDYLYDAYSEREHYPLANGPKHKRRKHKEHRGRREYYEDAVGTVPHGVPAASSSARDTRYSDMAPKHWDGEPPRYQNPPMAPPSSEYERPPPYYYPGAVVEQD